MVCLCWLLVVMAYVCVPGFESACLQSSICNDLSNKGRILDCIQLCMSVIQTELPELSSLALKVNDDDDLLLSILLATLASEDKISEQKLGAHSDKRRSYAMEHFRWGKPSGRKRRPVKIFASPLESGGSSQGSFPSKARRQLNSKNDEAKDDTTQIQVSPRAKVSAKSRAQFSPQERKDGTYRMSHFRWGSPPTSKRNDSFIKSWEEKGQLVKVLRNIIFKSMQRRMG
ncbi:pro-opiomelanocortin B-like [Scomber scombrus]|uniref:Pro-opiomelanocortin B-like n=1 Tax=Scomber scombrus TaxID=13677 RepID=A0AAV1QIN7_SCOSC|nr:pro-opiomelanocortin B-like [Scomber scombrus]